jgi:hypothetical protein
MNVDLCTNPQGQAAVPDGKGRITFVLASSVPDGIAWGYFRYVDDSGLAQVARGPKPPAGLTTCDWVADDRDAPGVPGVAFDAKKPTPISAPSRFAEAVNRISCPVRARLAPTDLQLQAGHGGIVVTHGLSGGSGPAESADAQWEQSRARVFGKTKV